MRISPCLVRVAVAGVLLLPVLLNPATCRAAADAGLPGSFLLQPAGARGTALGFSYGAVAGDASALYWNPAGLSLLSKPELNISQTWLFEGTGHTFLAYAHPVGKRVGVAGAYIRQASSGFEKRETPFDTPRDFSVSNQALLLGAGVKVPFAPFPVRAGLAFKKVVHEVESHSDSGSGVDAGFRAEPFRNWTLASVFHNVIRPSTELVSRESTYPSGLTLSVAYARELSREVAASFSAGARKYERGDAEPSCGVELSFKKSAALRLSADADGFSGGVGLKSGNYLVDYAARFNELASVHVISLSVRFGITMAELEEYIRRGIDRFDKEEASKLAGAYIQQAEILNKKKNYVQAIKNLETAALWDPSDRTISDRIEKVRREMDSSLNLQMRERNSLIATQYFDRGNYVSSREYWQSVLELDPADERAKSYLEKIETLITRKEKEQLEQEKAEAARRRMSALLEEAADLLKAEKYSQAAAKAKSALGLVPGDKQADTIIAIAREGLALSVRKRLARVTVLCETKLYAEALEIIDTILEDDPAQKEAMEKGADCRNALKPGFSPDDAKKIEKRYYMAVDAYLKNEYGKSAQLIEEIFKMDPLNESARKLREKIKKAGWSPTAQPAEQKGATE